MTPQPVESLLPGVLRNFNHMHTEAGDLIDLVATEGAARIMKDIRMVTIFRANQEATRSNSDRSFL